mmetsp:Transcript_10743/g.22969  ORF Transcript_10743/g.22969 Transcript_10743/m.22969 type:complete len:204 (-) Transcript_10743:258-869(-)
MDGDLCSVCEEYIASWYCAFCNRKICQECDEVIHLIRDKADHERVPLQSQNYIPSRSWNSAGQGFVAEGTYRQPAYRDHQNSLNGAPTGYSSSLADSVIAFQDQRQDHRPDYGAYAYGGNESFAQASQAAWSGHIPYPRESNGCPKSYDQPSNQGHYSQPFSSDVLSGAADYYTTSQPNPAHQNPAPPTSHHRQNTAASNSDT